MFDLSWSELLVIGVVALIAIGPKELPGALRALGHWVGKIRRMANDFQDQFRDAMREAEVADLKKQVDEMADTAKSYTNFDPMGDIRKDFESYSSDGSVQNPTSSASLPGPADTEVTPAPGAPTPEVSHLPPATQAAADIPVPPPQDVSHTAPHDVSPAAPVQHEPIVAASEPKPAGTTGQGA